ncbi:MAG TPA: hypothetical protein VGO34_04535 [Alphaproteobacteria bacterium]|jgi:hypothetical protein
MVKALNRSLDSSVEDRLFADLQREGVACLEDAVTPEYLQLCRARVEELLREKGERYFTIIQPWKENPSFPFELLATDPAFLALMRNLSVRGHSPDSVAGQELYNVLRVIAGQDSGTRAFEFHYDATVVTILMPLFIPGGEPNKSGDLVALPLHRGYRRFALLNVIEKVLLQNPIAYRLYGRRFGKGDRNVVKLKSGNLYFFWGYRTLHGNLPCEPNRRRATLLFHYGDPHRSSLLTKGILRLRRLREQIRLGAR